LIKFEVVQQEVLAGKLEAVDIQVAGSLERTLVVGSQEQPVEGWFQELVIAEAADTDLQVAAAG
jgi:hypothetical protein